MNRVVPLTILAVILFSIPGFLPAQEIHYPDHFRVFTGEGEPTSLERVVDAMEGVDAVLVGEIHTDPVGHWIEAELLGEALARFGSGEGTGGSRPVALSLEMFERDVQGILDEYLQDLITESQFRSSARPWEHYDADYRLMVELAKEEGAPVIAANAPRRYVNRVTRLGRDALLDLSPTALSFLPPLPYPEPAEAYRREWTDLMSNMSMEPQCPPPPETETQAEREGEAVHERMEKEHPGGNERADSIHPAIEMPPAGPPSHMASFMENGLQAQTLWDATMAHAITTFLDETPRALVLHMVGGFHVRNFTGTPEKIQDYRPGTRVLVVTMETVEDFHVFDPAEHGGAGDFVILTDESLDLNVARNCPGGEGSEGG